MKSRKSKIIFLILAIIQIALCLAPMGNAVFATYQEDISNEELLAQASNNRATKDIQNDEPTQEIPATFTQYKGANGDKYDYNPTKNTSATQLAEELFLVGHYQLNYTGGTAIARGAFGNAELYNSKDGKYFSKLSRLGGNYAFLEAFEEDQTSNGVTILGNSSAGTLKAQNTGDKVVKAYLVVSQKRNKSHYHLENCKITLIGPKQNKYIKTKMQKIEATNASTNRYVGYMDITDFVQDQGYGEYICCNVPYEPGDTDDQYASWRIIVVEENEANIPLRALSLKIGTAVLSGTNSLQVSINRDGIKSLSGNNITGQLFYSVDGADESKNSNILSLTIDEQEKFLYDGANWNTNYRTKELPLHYIFTRNGVPIQGSLSKFDNSLTVKKYKEHDYNGADADLIDITGKDDCPIVVPSSSSSFKFKFGVQNSVTLQPTALGLAIDIEGTEYKTEITTENVENPDDDPSSNDKTITIKGNAENIKGNNNTGLHKTKTVITLDSDIDISKLQKSNVKAVAHLLEDNREVKNVTIEEADIEINSAAHTITISWGRDKDTTHDLTLYGDKMSFEITGIAVAEHKTEYQNKVEVIGSIYASGTATDTELELAPNTSSAVYEEVTVEKIWKDDGNETLRPENIEVEFYKNGDETTPKHTLTLNAQNNWKASIRLIVEDSDGKYTYKVKEVSFSTPEEGKDYYISKLSKEEVSATQGGKTNIEITNTIVGTTSVTVNKVWNDYGNIRGKRPEQIEIELLANGKTVSNEENGNLYKKTVSQPAENSDTWTQTFEGLPKYDENGKTIAYTAKENEVKKGDLSEYVAPKVTAEGNVITLTNSYKEKEAIITTNVEKTAEIIAKSSNPTIHYVITFNVSLEQFIGVTTLTITDTLPANLAVNEQAMALNGGTYNKATNTITWTFSTEEILKMLSLEGEVLNTYKDGKDGVITLKIVKDLGITYKNLTIEQPSIENKVNATFAVESKVSENTVPKAEYQSENSVVNTLETATLTVKHIDRATGKELASEEQKMFVGDLYKTQSKAITDYELVAPQPDNAEGTLEGNTQVKYYYEKLQYNVTTQITNGTITTKVADEEHEGIGSVNAIIHDDATVTFAPNEGYYVSSVIVDGVEQDMENYYLGGSISFEDISANHTVVVNCERIPGIVVVEYKDENGKSITDPSVIHGFVGDEYVAEPLDIKGYVFDRSEGDTQGQIEAGIKTITFIYKTTKPKDVTPKTGTVNITNYVTVITMLSIAGIIILKRKYNN